MVDAMTVELLREARRNIVTGELSKHEKRLEGILDRKVIYSFAGRRNTDWAKRMQALGFSSVVDTDWVLRFKYHGDIFGNCVHEGRGARRLSYQYNGDIPEFALDNLENFLENNDRGWHRVSPHSTQILGWVSIHSMQALPVKLVRILPVIDPVIIGWAESPRFVHTQSGWAALSNPLGVIIAAWDEYKEVVDYKVEVKHLSVQ